MGVFLESLTSELLLILISLLTGVYLYAKYTYQFFNRLGIPCVESTFPLGSTWNVLTLRENFGDTITNLYNESKQRWKGVKMFGYFQCMQPELMITDPELIHQILIKDFTSFQDHGIPIDEEVNPMEGHLFNLSGAKWRTLRYKLSPTFTSGKLKWMFGTMDEVADHLISYLSKNLNQDLEMRDILCRFTTDVIGTCAFGLDPGAIDNPESEFRKMGNKIFHPDTKQVIVQLLRFLFPTISLKIKQKTISQDVNDFFLSITAQAFEHRIKTGDKRNDFIQLLLQLKQKGFVEMDSKDINEIDDDYILKNQIKIEAGDEEKLVFTDVLLAAQTFVFFVAGFETSAASMSFTAYQLANNQDAQKRLRQEVRQMKAKFGGITYDALKNMPFLESCIWETMRFYPPFQMLFRKSTKPYKFPDGTSIPEGLNVIIPIKGLHLDPEYFPDPDKFIPERFMPGETRIPGTYLPFGDGPRVCIAQRFALLELKLGLAKMIDNFHITKSSKLQEPIVLDPLVFITMPKGGMWLRFEKAE